MPLAKDNTSDYWSNDEPLCPHCDETCGVSENEWWELLDTQKSTHKVECPHCGKEFSVEVRCSFSFSTDDQPEPEESPVSDETNDV